MIGVISLYGLSIYKWTEWLILMKILRGLGREMTCLILVSSNARKLLLRYSQLMGILVIYMCFVDIKLYRIAINNHMIGNDIRMFLFNITHMMIVRLMNIVVRELYNIFANFIKTVTNMLRRV